MTFISDECLSCLEWKRIFQSAGISSKQQFSPGEVDVVGQIVVQVGEGDFVLCPDGLSDDDFVDVVELVPVFIPTEDTEEPVRTQNSQLLFSHYVWNQTAISNKKHLNSALY